jgi:hypothetical protein
MLIMECSGLSFQDVSTAMNYIAETMDVFTRPVYSENPRREPAVIVNYKLRGNMGGSETQADALKVALERMITVLPDWGEHQILPERGAFVLRWVD